MSNRDARRCSATSALSHRLQTILEAQNRPGGYRTALREIRAGRKSTHWIWYIWPALKQLRPKTSRPHFLLPDFDAARAYVRHPTLCGRFHEITTAAVTHLQQGVNPRVLFGSVTDCSKFQECMTVFAVAAAAELHMAMDKCLQGSGDTADQVQAPPSMTLMSSRP